ncbi:MAG: hypothetical protein AB1656_16755 [Candidatus Omnitrophota bacterium]
MKRICLYFASILMLGWFAQAGGAFSEESSDSGKSATKSRSNVSKNYVEKYKESYNAGNYGKNYRKDYRTNPIRTHSTDYRNVQKFHLEQPVNSTMNLNALGQSRFGKSYTPRSGQASTQAAKTKTAPAAVQPSANVNPKQSILVNPYQLLRLGNYPIRGATAAIQFATAMKTVFPAIRSAADIEAASLAIENATPEITPVEDEKTFEAPVLRSPAELLYEQGVDAFSNRNYYQSRIYFERLLAIDPENEMVQLYFGLDYFVLGNYAEARKAIQNGLALARKYQTEIPPLEKFFPAPSDFRVQKFRLTRFVEKNPQDVDAATLLLLINQPAK